jgi:predicted dehydrogenase
MKPAWDKPAYAAMGDRQDACPTDGNGSIFMNIKVAFSGFRHGHVQAMYNTAKRLDYVDIVALVDEGGPEAHGSSIPALGVELTHESLDQVIAEVDFDVLACVDYYANRGPSCIKALEAGKHVVTDKPLCTSLEDLKTIARLSREKNLQVGIDLTMRYGGDYGTLAGIVSGGGIGEISSCMVTGLHPLAYGSRPMWYFEGKQRGTINDLMIHGLDLMRWATGLEYSKVIFGEAWTRRARQPFQDSAQMALECLPRNCLGNTSEEILALVRGIDAVGICVDTNHALQEKTEDFIRRVGSRVVTIHVADYDGIDEKHWLPGKGINNWTAIVKALQDVGYAGPFLFECQGTPQEKVAVWKDLQRAAAAKASH